MTRLLPLAAAGLAALAGPQLFARASAAGAMHPVASPRFRAADAALVLGARVFPDGRPSRALRQRVETGAALFHRGVVPRLVLTGAADNREGLDETEAMERTALGLGVPAEAIVRDGSGHDTRASARNARDALGLASVIVCTQEFHVPRAMWLCRSVGLGAQGAFPPVLAHRDTALGYARELPATWKAALEIARDSVAPGDAPR
ncbi:SanA/YdcF family protein [Demequina subtropica]|uniref:SanA/YdcF family protein n=1 Tax=Demequina subtropica TaxID=1638989 RepID=UPI000782E0E0|nr:YdcF family protein [Demequina subtropica]